MIWGFAGPWYGEYECWKGDQLERQLDFIVKHGFTSMQIGLNELDDPKRRDFIAGFVAQHDLRLTTGVHLKTLAPDPAVTQRQTVDFLEKLRRYKDLLRVPIVTTGAGAGHRFDRTMPLDEKLDRMAAVFAPLAQGCFELGCPLGIENHGDFYCSDLVRLCERVPHMHMFLDTGNTYLIGEKSVEGCADAAPYTIGTHFKDHYVCPDPGKLTFVLDGAPLGSGDVGLAEVFGILRKKAPDPDNLVMHWELVTPKGMNPLECMEKSWEFVRSLER